MARKTDFSKRLNPEDTSKFCNRLWGLMQAKGINRPNTLAALLCENNYLSTDRETARKTITKHLNTECVGLEYKLQVEYIIAYSKFFGCSTDYLLMEIGKENFELEYVEKTYGLDKKALQALSEIKGLQEIFGNSSNAKYKLINLILTDAPLQDSNDLEISSFIETLISYMEFNPQSNEHFYKYTKKGFSDKPFKKTATGGISCNPLALNFSTKDIKVLYQQKILDSIEQLKKQYNKAPGTN